MNNLVSVIIPIHNVEKYLGKCIESVTKQTYSNLEIILVDDESPDSCGKICDEWAKKDDRIIVIHKKNGGLSSARNAGIDICKGDYILFIDSDDYIELDMIEKMYKKIIDTSSDICICNYLWEYPNKIKKKTFSDKTIVVNNDNIYDFLYNEYALLTIVSWNKLYKKQLFENIRFPEGRIHEDQYVICDILEHTEKMVYILDEYFYHYVQRDGSIMSKFNMKRFDIVLALDRRVKFFEQKNDIEKVLITKAVEALELIDLIIKTKKFEFNAEEKNIIKSYEIKLDNIVNELYCEKKLNKSYRQKLNLYHISPTLFMFIKKIKSLLK